MASCAVICISYLHCQFCLQFIFGFGIPVTLLDQSMTMGVVLKFGYDIPTNATVFTNPYAATEKRSARKNTRWDMYSVLEATVDRMNLDGRACVLRAICEAADTTLLYNGLAGELLHVLLTPSTTMEGHRSYLDTEYHAAERLGSEISGSCHLLYSECKIGLLDLISKFEL
ncbi:hypothetical protein B7P43_G06737 [Cryptotermes secundus]|uniref:Uncharacterized protein n=1 Tax=Cryptotermes secundus TaxID=105785 RepID=A0A2J7QZ72_9NEOP|nr:hypothetical protein B7P43_G06737 [Cryptotermes secundus]